ncbi:MAG: hypothetical protein HYU57_03285 [Micavibrio aeruginosavorus]|nr:hypothetical protein [Micavibrio aeruginosavorus]
MAYQYARIWKAGAAGLSLAFTLHAAIAESFPPTENEKALAAAIFGNKIDMNGITVHFTKEALVNQITGGPLPAELKDGKNIFFYESELFSDDFGAPEARMEARSIYVHELTHIMQFQIGWDKALCKSGENKTYTYSPKPGTTFADYCPEQQATMVQDYADRFLFNEREAPHFMAGKSDPEKVTLLQEIVEAAFPAARETRLKGGFSAPFPKGMARSGKDSTIVPAPQPAPINSNIG